MRLSFRQITDKVEYYWITRSAHDANDFSLWAFNGTTLKVTITKCDIASLEKQPMHILYLLNAISPRVALELDVVACVWTGRQ